MRMLLSVGILTVAVGWIVLSYLPSVSIMLPKFQYAPDGIVRIFPGLMIAGFLAFVALQLWVVETTAVSVRRHEESVKASSPTAFNLTVGREAFLTALPIVFTVLLGLASYGWWQRLAALN